VEAPPVLESPHLTGPLPEEAELERLCRAAAHSPFPCRDRAVLHMFWCLGLTVPELLLLRAEDVDCRSGRVRWGAGREGVLPAEALWALTVYMRMERPPGSLRLFADGRGQPLTRPALARIFCRLARASGLRGSPQALRLAALWRAFRADPPGAVAELRRGARRTGGGGASDGG
jgi:integrase